MWTRKCQECGNIQTDTRPQGEMTDAYRNRKCKRCKSMGLDYGKDRKWHAPQQRFMDDDSE